VKSREREQGGVIFYPFYICKFIVKFGAFIHQKIKMGHKDEYYHLGCDAI